MPLPVREYGGYSPRLSCERDHEVLRLSAAVAQAVHDANNHALPVVAHRSNRQPWLLTVRLEDVLQFLHESEMG